ncbi:MAG: GNAT family N-acetyltransferase [Tissierellia bacterium]|nr:GNAT family N-acetyltransferase [Tissierellia bacterium]
MFKIRRASPQDIPTFLDFTRALADFEEMSHMVVASEEDLNYWLFEKKTAHLLIGEVDGRPVATALYFYNFSTFEGRAGIYLEDLIVLPEHRGQGYGTAMLRYLAQLALNEGCGRFEWICLDWNEKAISIYEGLGAKALPEWLLFRMDEETMRDFAQGL